MKNFHDSDNVSHVRAEADAAIDTVLRGLGEVQSAADFEGQLLLRLAERPVMAKRERRRGWLSRWPMFAGEAFAMRRIAGYAGTAAAVLLTLALALVSRHHAAPREVPRTGIARLADRAAIRPEVAGAGTVQPVAHAPSTAIRRAEVLRRGRNAAPRREIRVAASFPAPPMPLTAQEKLLLRAAHAGDPRQSALLDTNLRASVEAARAEEFHRFFIAATTIRDEDATN